MAINTGTLSFDQMQWDVTRIPQQQEFIFAPERHLAYFGGFNNGKTFSLCLRTINQSLLHKNNCGMICRRTYKELKDTTMNQFFSLFGCNESNIQEHPYVEKYSQSELFLRFVNGSEVYFRPLDDERSLAKILSWNGNWAAFDQAEEITESAYLYMLSRIGRVNTGIPVWIGLAGNPAGHDWIWERFKKEKRPNHRLIEAKTTDNPFVGEGYVETLLREYSQHWIERFVYGDWDSFKGQVYQEFNPDVHVIRSFDVPVAWKCGAGMDSGFNHPTAFIFGAVDYFGNLHIYDELVDREKLPEYYVEKLKLKGIEDKNGIQLPIYGPHDIVNRNPVSGKNIQQAYADLGMILYRGNQEKPIVRITDVKRRLKIRAGKHPYKPDMNITAKMFIHDNCSHTIEGFNRYRWKELKLGEEGKKAIPDEVVKVNDDEMDALGYMCLGYASSVIPERPVEPGEIDEMEYFVQQSRNLKHSFDWRYN